MGIKKDVFKMKMTGDFQLIMEYAFMFGYHSGYGRGIDEKYLTMEEVEAEFKRFMDVLDEDMKGNITNTFS